MTCEKDSNLTRDEAIKRRTIINPGMTYRLFLDLQKGKVFNGFVHAKFDVQHVDTTFIEFSGQKIVKMLVNNKEITDIKWEKGYIYLDQTMLKTGENTYLIHFENEYYNDGNGLHSFIDELGDQYVHSQCEPHACNRIFPVFDQPDLKGCLELAVRAPSKWEVISTEVPLVTQPWAEWQKRAESADAAHAEFYTLIKAYFGTLEGENIQFIHYEKSPLLSCYLYTVICGDFAKIKCPKDALHRDIPQTMYFKKNMSEFAKQQSKAIFELNSKGIAKYEEIFGYLYPFTKCDSIFCPEYTMGAMENPGAITYHENYLYASVPTRSQETDRASTILHELAHMWFGDLVTMKWWDDLWLNESFADFVCYLNMHLIIPSLSFPLDDAWMCMHDRKSFGYNADESESTTHPIYGEVPDIETTQSIFDGITYSKGASVLKQLYSLVGLDNFSKAMAAYFNKYQWKNTVLNDLLAEFTAILDSKAEGCYNLDKFRQDWIETAGHNVLSCDWSADSTQLMVKQRAHLVKYPTLRYHKIKAGLYGDCGKLLRSVDVIVNNTEVTTVDCGDMTHVKAVVLNYDDLDFVKIEIDGVSFDWIKSNFNKIDSDISKALIARALFDQVKESKTIRSFEYLLFFAEMLKAESSTTIVEMMHGFAAKILESYSSESNQKRFAPELFNATLEKLRETKDEQMSKLLVDMLVSYILQSKGDSEFEALYNLYSGKDDKLTHVKLILLQKWRIVLRLQAWSKLSDDYKKKLVDDLAAEDTTDNKANYKLMIKGINMHDDERAKMLESLDKDTHGLSFDSLGYLLIGFNHPLIPASKKEPFYDEYFEKLPEWINAKTHELCKTICSDLMPGLSDLAVMNQKLEVVLGKISNKYFIRSLKSKIDQNITAKKIIEYGEFKTELK